MAKQLENDFKKIDKFLYLTKTIDRFENCKDIYELFGITDKDNTEIMILKPKNVPKPNIILMPIPLLPVFIPKRIETAAIAAIVTIYKKDNNPSRQSKRKTIETK